VPRYTPRSLRDHPSCQRGFPPPRLSSPRHSARGRRSLEHGGGDRRQDPAAQAEITTPLSGARDDLYRSSFAGQDRLAGRLREVGLPRFPPGTSQRLGLFVASLPHGPSAPGQGKSDRRASRALTRTRATERDAEPNRSSGCRRWGSPAALETLRARWG